MSFLSERNTPSLLVYAGLLGAIVLALLHQVSLGIWALLGGVLLSAVYMLWQSARLLAGDTEVASELGGARFDPRGLETDLDEEKRSLLTQLKDLERERRIGKLSQEDYDLLAADYRERAKQVLAAIDTELSPQMSKAAALLSADDAATDVATDLAKGDAMGVGTS